ncbi:hypothetical protein EDB81DRAFT_704766 [Dactylonectria macrodidyma]|uniref:Metallo-beta-lactamase domain-containing protein n=1 Tax=Dactylonectria macrodidyma TaxID=307937 RepID=A0A9P9CYA0_9HYPO|nr:hypothetical protein EDB81DRAFT_704766 [Dactylonectria macrodidyma]
MVSESDQVLLEWFGATTYRVRWGGLTIFLDTWLERPSVLEKYLPIDDVSEAYYIFISHAHFDHLPGADRLALKTGAVIVANAEAVNHLRAAGVPEEQLISVAGGERIPLFSKSDREKAVSGECPTAPGPPGAPPLPHPSLAVMSVHVWPSLHCLLPGNGPHDLPDVFDTGKVYTGSANPYACTIDVNRGMRYGMLRMGELMPRDKMNDGQRSFADYVADRKQNVMSACDGGQLAFNLLFGEKKTVLWSAHLGAYKGILQDLEPKPDVAILGIAGRGNLNGRPFDGSAAQFAVDELEWLGFPPTVIWCLHDDSAVKPLRVDTKPATELVEAKTQCKVMDLKPAVTYKLF